MNGKDIKIHLNQFSFLYNSFSFRTFYFILELLIANKIFLNDVKIILKLYETILLLDKINIKTYSDYYDFDNIL